MNLITDKINAIAEKLNENVDTPAKPLIVDSLGRLAEALGTTADKKLITDQLDIIAENVNAAGIIPEGNLAITEDGDYNCYEYATASVNVPYPRYKVTVNISVSGDRKNTTISTYGYVNSTDTLPKKINLKVGQVDQTTTDLWAVNWKDGCYVTIEYTNNQGAFYLTEGGIYNAMQVTSAVRGLVFKILGDNAVITLLSSED